MFTKRGVSDRNSEHDDSEQFSGFELFEIRVCMQVPSSVGHQNGGGVCAYGAAMAVERACPIPDIQSPLPRTVQPS